MAVTANSPNRVRGLIRSRVQQAGFSGPGSATPFCFQMRMGTELEIYWGVVESGAVVPGAGAL